MVAGPPRQPKGTMMFDKLQLSSRWVPRSPRPERCWSRRLRRHRRPGRARRRGAASGEPLTGVRFMVPNTAGGGYDTTARAGGQGDGRRSIATESVEVFNLAGAGGTVGLSRTVTEKGNGKLLMLMGLGVVGAAVHQQVRGQARPDHPDRQADRGVRRDRGAEGLPVPDDQRPGRRLEGRSRRRSPSAAAPRRADRTTCCRCSSPRRSASTPSRSTSSPTTAAATCCPALLGGKIAFGASGFGEFLDQVEAGEVRVLAISGAERVDAVDAPTLKESGIDLVFTNWRGVVAPPEISDADKAALDRAR